MKRLRFCLSLFKSHAGKTISRILSSTKTDHLDWGPSFLYTKDYSLALAILPGSLTLAALIASLFDLAPRRVWLFSLQQLPQGLPFPTKRSMPWTFSLFHCSAPYDGGPLTPTLPYGVRTFLPVSQRNTAMIHFSRTAT